MLQVEIGLGVPRRTARIGSAKCDVPERVLGRVHPFAAAKDIRALENGWGGGAISDGVAQVREGTHRAAAVGNLEQSEGCGVVSKPALPGHCVISIALKRVWTVRRKRPGIGLARSEERRIGKEGRSR